MGAKEKRLKLLFNEHYEESIKKIDIKEVLNSEFSDEIQLVYQKLGGAKEFINFRGKWDFKFKNFFLEFDEEAHFNRYRYLTLDSSLYNRIPNFPTENYKEYCVTFENNCIKKGYGGYWSNQSSEKMFGPSDLPKKFIGLGSSRWKQRAFYDFVKDVSFLYTGITVVRLSIYDNIIFNEKEIRLDRLLNDSTISDKELLAVVSKLINKWK